MNDWDSRHRWREQIERRLNQVGAMVKGSQDFTSDRICDVIEQIDDLRRELAAMKARQDKIAEYVRANVPKRDKSGEA